MKKTASSINKSARHDGKMAELADHLRQTLAQTERHARKTRRLAKQNNIEAPHQSPRGRTVRDSHALDLMAAIMREAEARQARQRARFRACRRPDREQLGQRKATNAGPL